MYYNIERDIMKKSIWYSRFWDPGEILCIFVLCSCHYIFLCFKNWFAGNFCIGLKHTEPSTSHLISFFYRPSLVYGTIVVILFTYLNSLDHFSKLYMEACLTYFLSDKDKFGFPSSTILIFNKNVIALCHMALGEFFDLDPIPDPYATTNVALILIK